MAKFSKKGAEPKGDMIQKFREKQGRTTDALIANTGQKASKKMLKGMDKAKFLNPTSVK